MLDKITAILLGYLDIIPIIISSIILLYVSYLVSKATSLIVKKMMPKSWAIEIRSFTPKLCQTVAFILCMIMTMRACGIEANNLMTIMGLSTIAIGMAFKDLFVNTIHGAMILFNHTYVVGNEISVRDATGTVVKIDLIYTKIVTENEVKYIPNSVMFSEIVTVKKS